MNLLTTNTKSSCKTHKGRVNETKREMEEGRQREGSEGKRERTRACFTLSLKWILKQLKLMRKFLILNCSLNVA